MIGQPQSRKPAMPRLIQTADSGTFPPSLYIFCSPSSLDSEISFALPIVTLPNPNRPPGIPVYWRPALCSECVHRYTGKSDPYCEVSMGNQLHKTKVVPNTLNPKWNSSMQFPIKSIEDDVLCFTVFDQDRFSPNGETLI